MKLETLTTTCKEVFIDTSKMTVTVNTWSNMEGASIMVHGKDDFSLRMAGAFRWEELDAIMVAITAARTA
jgi:hypothetical protein